MKLLVAGSLGTLVAGLPGGVVAAGAVVALSRRMPKRRHPADVVTVSARLLVMVSAGASVVPALHAAVAETGLEADVTRLLRRARRLGTATAFASAAGPLAPLLRSLGEATLAGTALEPAIRSFIESERRRRHLRGVERARRLPVRLMVPMTLLVLPGFVLVVYGPALLGLVTDLLGPLSGG